MKKFQNIITMIVGLFLGAREKVLNVFKSRIFPIKDEIPTLEITPETECEPHLIRHLKTSLKKHLNQHLNQNLIQKHFIHLKHHLIQKISQLKLREDFYNEIANEQKIWTMKHLNLFWVSYSIICSKRLIKIKMRKSQVKLMIHWLN